MLENVVFSIGRVDDSTYTALGTCVLIDGFKKLFVTAAHVTGGNDKDLAIRLNTTYDALGYQDTSNNECATLDVKIIAINTLKDVCILSLVNQQSNIPYRVTLSNTDSLSIGEELIVTGFPHSSTGRIVLTQQDCTVGAKILLKSGPIKSKHIVLNIQARPGQSGGPVTRKSDGSLVAILIGAYVPPGSAGVVLFGDIDPQTLHQTTHAVSAEYIKEMLRDV